MNPYNDRIEKARASVGKENTHFIDAGKDNFEKYRQELIEAHRLKELAKLQYAYGVFLNLTRLTKKEFNAVSNYPDKTIQKVFGELMRMNLIGYVVTCTNDHHKIWYIVDEKFIPEGWPAKGVLMTMESPYANYVPRVVMNKKEKSMIETNQEIKKNNALTRMLMNEDQHVEDVTPYEQFLNDTAKFYGKEELDDLVKAVHDICKLRIQQKFVECPLCKGRIQRNNAEARCTKCGALLNMGTFEESMRGLNAMAKAGVRVR